MLTRRSFLCTSLAAGTALVADSLALPATKKPRTSVPVPSIPVQREPVVYLAPGDPGYPEARQVFNASITTKPRLIARCTTESGVQEALKRGAETKSAVAVKAGGHSFEGFCLNDDGMVINVSPMRELKLDAKTGLLTAGAGCRVVDINDHLLERGRFLPSGSCETVGIAGLTLGGGYGMFARRFGLTCDHLRAVRMVDGSGRVRDSHDEPELLWACRGGGNGHFGIVTQLTFQTRPAPRHFSSWKFRIYKLDAKRATAVLETWFAMTEILPREAFSAWVMNGSQVTIVVTTTGPREQKGLAAACKKFGSLSGRTTTAGPVELRKALPWYYGDPTPTYFKNCSAGYYKGMNDVRGALPSIFKEVLGLPGVIFQVNTMGGAIEDGDDSAYPHRAYPYLGEQQTFWDKPAQAESRIAAAGRIREALASAGVRHHYANYPDLAFKDWPAAYYGEENYKRLQKLKLLYDPENRIRHPQSVRLPGA